MTHVKNTFDIPAPPLDEATLSRKPSGQTLGIAAAVGLAGGIRRRGGGQRSGYPRGPLPAVPIQRRGPGRGPVRGLCRTGQGRGPPASRRLFDALVAAENMHAEWLLRLSNGVRSTADNLKAGRLRELPGREGAAGHRRPGGSRKGRQGRDPARKPRCACLRHETVMRQVREQVLSGHDMAAQTIWICPTCGTVLVGVAPDTCPVCDTPKAKYVRGP